MQRTQLKRSISLPYITFYGLGTILGAGVYVLIGKVAGASGLYAPFSFALAALVACFTAFSYCELSSRYPKSAGESVYIHVAFNKTWLSTIVGLLVILTGIVSAATIINGFVGYLNYFITVPSSVAIISLVTGLTILAVWGITESVVFATVVTLIEIAGLLFVIIVAGDNLGNLSSRWQELLPEANASDWLGIILGSFLAFYAFIGFEDIVNIAEEVKNPKKNLPLAILLSFFIAFILYLTIAVIAVLAMPIDILAKSDAPLASLLMGYNESYGKIISLISLIAVVNGALVQVIMSSRVMYGMSCQNLISKIFSPINKKTKTPVRSTLFSGSIVLILSLWFPLVTLAKATSFIVLLVFLLVNISLIVIKKRTPVVEHSVCYTILLPIIGAVLSFLLIFIQVFFIFYS